MYITIYNHIFIYVCLRIKIYRYIYRKKERYILKDYFKSNAGWEASDVSRILRNINRVR